MKIERIDAIDGLRGIAALAVALLHLQEWFIGTRIAFWGDIPTQLFFVLSGYILSAKYEEGLRTGALSAGKFIVQRISRLWPLHLFALGLLLLTEFVLWNYYGSVHALHTTDTSELFWLNVFMVHGWFGPATANFNIPSWSISSELGVNLLWMAALLWGRWSALTAIAAAAIATFVMLSASLMISYNAFAPVFGLEHGVWRTVLGFSLGCLLFWYVRRHGAHIPRWISFGAQIGTVVCLVLYTALRPYGADWLLAIVLLPLLTLAALEPSTVVSRIVSSRPFAFLGRISYGVYLLHVPLASLMSLVFLWGIKLPNLFVFGLVWLALVLISATLTLYLVERPGMWLIRTAARKVVRTKSKTLTGQL